MDDQEQVSEQDLTTIFGNMDDSQLASSRRIADQVAHQRAVAREGAALAANAGAFEAALAQGDRQEAARLLKESEQAKHRMDALLGNQ